MRIKITIPLTKTIPGKARAVAQDEDGVWYWYEKKPKRSSNQWNVSGSHGQIAKGIPNPDWENTLIMIETVTADET